MTELRAAGRRYQAARRRFEEATRDAQEAARAASGQGVADAVIAREFGVDRARTVRRWLGKG